MFELNEKQEILMNELNNVPPNFDKKTMWEVARL